MKSKKLDQLVLFLIPIGVAVNFVGGQIAILLRLPVYLDCIGTVVVGALCGVWPGVLVGVISNVLNSISSPVTMFYAILSAMFGALAAYLSKKRVFLSLGKTALSSLLFAFIGGALGACMTWVIYGFDFGSITSSVYAALLYETLHLPAFLCQLIGEFGMDLLDKFVCIIIVYFVLKAFPNRMLAKLPLGDIYAKEEA